jgi:membrane-associated protease RseP (regulator of RpoE activity)
MTMQERLRKQRLGALLVLGAVALAVIITVVLAAEYSEHWGKKNVAQLPKNEPMELRGTWLGMRLTAADSPSARAFGIPANVNGVVVAEVSQAPDSRALGGGIQPGDVIVKVDNREIESLAELQTLSNKLDVLRPLPIQILRQGQPMSFFLPPPAGMGGPQATPVAWQRSAAAYGPGGCPRWPGAGPNGAGPNAACPTPGWNGR